MHTTDDDTYRTVATEHVFLIVIRVGNQADSSTPSTPPDQRSADGCLQMQQGCVDCLAGEEEHWVLWLAWAAAPGAAAAYAW